MPTSKKISELPVFSNVQAGDILPIVDYTLTQTGRCTASQISAIGGGPPGVNTIDDTMVKAGGITSSGIGFSAADRLIYSGPNTSVVNGVTRYRGEEATLTPYARTFLQQANAEAARAYLAALASTENPAFTGQVRLEGGTAAYPNIIRNFTAAGAIPGWSTSNLGKTGIFFPDLYSIAFSINSSEKWRLSEDGYVWTPLDDSTSVRPGFPARAFVCFSGTALAGTATTINANQLSVASRYGLNGTLADNENTRARIKAIENARGIDLLLRGATSLTYNPAPQDTSTFTASYNQGVHPLYRKGTESRSNYTSPENNTHWSWSGTAFTPISANGVNWIGTVTYTTQAAVNPVFCSANVASIQRQAAGHYRINLSHSMPATQPVPSVANPEQFAVIATAGHTANVGMYVFARDTTATGSMWLDVKTSTGADCDQVNVVVFR